MKSYFHFSNMCLAFESSVAGVFFARPGIAGVLPIRFCLSGFVFDLLKHATAFVRIRGSSVAHGCTLADGHIGRWRLHTSASDFFIVDM